MSTLPSDAGPHRSQTATRLRYAVRLALGVLLVAVLTALGGGPVRALRILERLSPAWFLLALVTYLGGQTLCAWRWSILAASQGFRQPWRFYWTRYLGAMFPSLFLPTSVGGDVVRAMALAAAEAGSAPDARSRATVSVLADRGTGILAMSWIAWVAVGFAPPGFPGEGRAGISTVAALLTAGFLAPFFVRPRLPRGAFWQSVLGCWAHPRGLWSSVLLAGAFQVLLCCIYVLLARALGLELPVGFCFLACPIVSLAALSPITLNGLGERAVALTLLFSLVHVGADQAVAFGLTWTAMTTAAALLGGLVLLLSSGGEPRANGRS